MITVEDMLEVLAGLTNNSVNIRIDSSDIKIITSIAKQVKNGTALTDRQLDLAIKKIKVYKNGLELNNIDVDSLLASPQTRYPLREIDRTQSISIINQGNKDYIRVQFPFSKKLSTDWRSIAISIQSNISEPVKNVKMVEYTENNLYKIVKGLSEHNFTLSLDVKNLYDEIETIQSNPIDYIPYIDLDNGELVVNNVSKSCENYIESNIKDEDFLVKIGMLKNCGISHKRASVLQKIDEETTDNLVKNVLVNTSTRFRLKPEEYDIDTVYGLIDRLKQWPLLILVDDKVEYLQEITNLINKLLKYHSNNEVTVFFRMDSSIVDCANFNNYVKDNGLNNFIDENTKVVVISRNRIPKPLYTSNWQPTTALVASSYDYGKTSAYLRNILNVYYYNHSLSVRYSKEYRGCEIVQL